MIACRSEFFGLKIPSAAGMAADLRDERKAEV